MGRLEHFWFSHILGIIIPICFHIFQRGRYTTNQTIIRIYNHHYHIGSFAYILVIIHINPYQIHHFPYYMDWYIDPIWYHIPRMDFHYHINDCNPQSILIYYHFPSVDRPCLVSQQGPKTSRASPSSRLRSAASSVEVDATVVFGWHRKSIGKPWENHWEIVV